MAVKSFANSSRFQQQRDISKCLGCNVAVPDARQSLPSQFNKFVETSFCATQDYQTSTTLSNYLLFPNASCSCCRIMSTVSFSPIHRTSITQNHDFQCLKVFQVLIDLRIDIDIQDGAFSGLCRTLQSECLTIECLKPTALTSILRQQRPNVWKRKISCTNQADHR